jgi:hypothetical protein
VARRISNLQRLFLMYMLYYPVKKRRNGEDLEENNRHVKSTTSVTPIITTRIPHCEEF